MYFFMSSSSFPCGFVKKAFRGNPDSPDHEHGDCHEHGDDDDDDHDYCHNDLTMMLTMTIVNRLIPGIEWAPSAIENISCAEQKYIFCFCS